jgi:hypothetical protein
MQSLDSVARDKPALQCDLDLNESRTSCNYFQTKFRKSGPKNRVGALSPISANLIIKAFFDSIFLTVFPLTSDTYPTR